MRIARIDLDGPVTAIADGDTLRPLPGVAVLDLLAAPPGERARLAATAGEPVSDVRLLAPLEPASVRDYSVFEQHGEGASMAIGGPDAKISPTWYEMPAFYFSNPHATTGPDEVITPPAGTTGLDLELEVAAIVCRRGRNLSVEDAEAHIGGYTIFNDWSERDIAAREAKMPFGFHKTKDFANTFGPWIVTPDELEPYRQGDRLNLRMTAWVNGRELGGDTLASMAWGFPELVAFAARGAWIAPGDVIASGTCGGGCLFELWGRNQGKEPPPLKPGDEVRLEVEGLGTLTNTIGEPHPELEPLPPARARECLMFALGTFARGEGEAFAGLVVDAQVHDLGPDTTTLALFRDWDASFEHLRALAAAPRGDGVPLRELRSLAPVAPAGQILCGGANYYKHLREMAYAHLKREGDPRSEDELRAAAGEISSRRAQEEPFVFAGLPSALCGANDDVILWGPGHDHDWELELAVVLGRGGRHIPEADALECVAGYTICNDVSTRDVMHRPGFPMTDFLMTKMRPTFFPTGPYVVPREFVPDYRRLRITLKVNGELMQDEGIDDIIYGVEALVAYASRVVELQPGDLLLTGSPAGNAAHHGNRWLVPGDVMEGAITGLGVQRNRCVAPGVATP